MIEYSYALTFYYKYAAGRKTIELARLASGLEIEYTGVLGRRTKYQKFDTAQLIMNVKNVENKEKAEKKEED